MNTKELPVFISAQWRNLILLNYSVPDQVLIPYLPSGCELDRYQDHAYLSLVAFQFQETRVGGIKWPGYTRFPEINLRFYVRYQGKRGVVFIKEFVPSHLIAWIARFLYNEPYHAARMTDQVSFSEKTGTAIYTLDNRGSRLHLEVQLENSLQTPREGSLEHFFKEHDLGVGRDREGNLITYEVSHPIWRTYPIQSYKLRINWGSLYGDSFQFLSEKPPESAVFAEGSEIKVYWKT